MRLFAWLLRSFFYLLYHPLAWTYDLVAWTVSLGRWRSWVNSALPWLAGPRALELGHGPGHLQVKMRNKGLLSFGLDRSPQMGRLAIRNSRKVGAVAKLTRGDALHLPFGSGSFDQVVATFPSEYIFEPQTLSEVHRVLAAKGVFIVLPLAWITGKSVPDRLAAWLFRVTGQAGEWQPRFTEGIAAAGFAVEEDRKDLGSSEVLLIVAQKK